MNAEFQRSSSTIRKTGCSGILCLLALLGLQCTAARGGAPSFVNENPWELQTGGDFDGDGRSDLVIVEKATGVYRIGYQLSPGVYTWVSPRASGIANATGLGVGKINSLSYDSIAVTGPDANRASLLDATNPATANLPGSLFIPSLGPNISVVLDIGGPTNTALDDLYVASIYNGISAFRETLLRNNGGTNQTVLADNSVSYLYERADAVLLHTNRAPRLALFARNTSVSTDALNLFEMSSGAAVSLTSVTTPIAPQPYEYVTGQFTSTNPYTQFLLYPPTGSNFLEYQVTEPSPGAYTLVSNNVFTVSNSIDRMFVLPGTNGPRLLVLFSGDLAAAVFDFDGQHAPTLSQQFTAVPGEHFTGAGALGNGGFMAYSAPLGQNATARFTQRTWTGSSYNNSASGSLPPVSGYSASGNVMQFQF